ncbi:unnamed protein product, partial [marine sediment metagenome]
MQSSKFLKITTLFVILLGILYLVINATQPTNQQEELSKVDLSKLPKTLQEIKKMVLVPSGAFYMDETPVTYADFQKYINAEGTKPKYWDYETYNQPEHPVTGINWYHAIDYCNWRSKIEGLSPVYKLTDKLDAWGYSLWELDDSANGYRLPTEAEFEYAARGDLEQKQFPWGDEFNSSLANYDDERGV